MNAFLESFLLFIVVGSFFVWALSFRFGTGVALVAGFGLVAVLILVGRHSAPVLFAHAIFSPIGIVVPALALGRMAERFGFRIKRFTLLELGAVSGLLVIFYASITGVLQIDLYGYGYSAKGAAVLCVAVCLYGLLTQRTSAIAVALAAQLLWMTNLVSDNIFDVFGHLVLVPVVLVELSSRLVELCGAKFRREPS